MYPGFYSRLVFFEMVCRDGRTSIGWEYEEQTYVRQDAQRPAATESVVEKTQRPSLAWERISCGSTGRRVFG